MTIVLGIIGSFVGGFLGFLIFQHDPMDGFFQPAGIIGSIIGAIIVLLIYVCVAGRDAPDSTFLVVLHRPVADRSEEAEVGKFIYGPMANSFDVDDRTLAHLRVVIMNKLRRSESFMFDLTMSDGSGSRSFWMGPSIPIQFQFFGGRNPRINRAGSKS